ncbi:MAG TPA: hypothetical protein VHS58_18770 [Acetobacteraceae bacterium]|jgi:hypothetical protein|nr:hypothetical protein [Acetobacteraceae bacterium]
MDGVQLQDLIRRGNGRAAVIAGDWCDAYRPRGVSKPLARINRFIKLPAVFTRPGGRASLGYGEPVWAGVFDAAYTKPGDYLVRAGDNVTWFVAAQEKLLPVVCVRTNRVVGFARPGAPSAAGVNSYGGVSAATAVLLCAGWPASVLTSGTRGVDSAQLPADGKPGAWTVLLPTIAGVVFAPGDLMTDDLGRTGVISTAELSALGWRLLVRQTTT